MSSGALIGTTASSTRPSPPLVPLRKYWPIVFKVRYMWKATCAIVSELTCALTAWRKLLKDLITYFREVGNSYEHRAKALLKVSNVINNTNAPAMFLTEGGLNDANRILRDYHKQSVTEANKASTESSRMV